MGIFDKRVEMKPYEYPEALEFMKALRGTMWFIDEFRESLKRDVTDYKYNLSETERGVIKRALIAISQIEVSVKTFWAKIGDKMPKAEIYKTGITCAHNEVIHEEAYSELLTELGIEDEFSLALQEPCIQGRVDYLTKYLRGASDSKEENYALTLILFSAFIEACSLFSQFYIIKSFCQRKQTMKTIDNIIMATAKEEDLHFQFGAYLTNIIKKENPDWFDDNFNEKIKRACKKAYEAEMDIVDWILGEEGLDFVSREEVDNFLKYRFNLATESVGIEGLYEVDQVALKESSQWFEEERVLDARNDFFDSQSINYAVGQQDISPDSLF
jgi:ribonucleoside-diphosphate reductase beta chain